MNFVVPNTECLKLLNAIITTVTLSRVLLSKEFFRIYSTAIPLYLWIFYAKPRVLLSWTLFHTQWRVSSFESLSNIPSQPSTMKSCSPVILNWLISGVGITTFGLPPYFESLASASPNVLDTDSLPGRTLKGPTIISFFEGSLASMLVVAVLWYIYPPASIILFLSNSSFGLWSLLSASTLLPPFLLKVISIEILLSLNNKLTWTWWLLSLQHLRWNINLQQ